MGEEGRAQNVGRGSIRQGLEVGQVAAGCLSAGDDMITAAEWT